MDDRDRLQPRMVSPVCSVDELQNAVRMGADEVYCGYISPALGELFGYDDLITRRQGHLANITSPPVLEALAAEALKLKTPIALTLNCLYSRTLLPHILPIAEFWAELGGHAIILTDIALLIALQRKRLPLQYHLSLMANAFNESTVAFFSELGIHRVVLPRELLVDEIAGMTARFPETEFEALVLHDRCCFIDGLCGFYHSTSFAPETITSAPWTLAKHTKEKCVYSSNLAYAGHGCDLLLDHGGRRHIQYVQETSDHMLPDCAACHLPALIDAGVRFVKIAGRGLAAADKARSVGFIRRAITIWSDHSGSENQKNRMKNLYLEMFGHPCLGNRCYYQKGA